MRRLFTAVLSAVFLSIAAQAEESVTQLTGDRLRAGELAPLAADLEERLAVSPQDDQARFALGATQFLMAVEHLGQGLHRYGLEAPRDIRSLMPLFRLPVPPNPHPEKLTFELMRSVLQHFVDDLAVAESTLSKVGRGEVKLPIAIGLVKLDLDGDGKTMEGESLWQVFDGTLGGGAISSAGAERFVIAFDRGDVAWLRGYAHLLSAISEFLLAYDWQQDFDVTFHMFFPRAGLPGAAVTEYSRPYSLSGMDDGQIADFIAFIHLAHWPVKDAAKMQSALHHLEAMVALSRESWKEILAETDNDGEWIPNPRQLSVIPETTVTQERIDGWLHFLDEFEALMAGKKLVPHWRLAKGFNLRRVFTEPTTFDPILWAQGSAALPYLEDGPLTTSDSWNMLMNVFEGNFLGYAMWFN